MLVHRFRQHVAENLLPQPATQPVLPNGFVMLPLAWLPGPIEQRIYQQAFEQAQAVARPSLLERDLLGFWN